MIPRIFCPEGGRAMVAALLYYAVLVGVSSIPGPELPEAAEVPGLDKVVHVVAYGGLGWLLGGVGWPWWVVLLTGVAAGGLDELYQVGVPGRQASWWDWVADGVGVCVGAWLRWRVKRGGAGR